MVLRSGFGILAGVAVMLFLLPGLRMGGISGQAFLPHAMCYLQDSRIIAVHATSDSLIGLSYLFIAGILGYLVYRARQDIPFHWVVAAFGLFIVACGFTHIMAVINIWRPLYWLSADVKIVTATASVATAIALPFVIPRVFQTIRAAKSSTQRKIELERAHQELRELYERVTALDAAKTEFFANVSHELRTPLTLILGPSEKLAASPRLSSGEREELAGIHRNGLRLLKQVNDLLELAKLDAGRGKVDYEQTNAAQLLRLTAANFRSLGEERQVRLLVEAPPELPLECDPGKVEQILLNLLSNAFKVIPAGGTVACRVGSHNSEVHFQVEDSGPGIPPDMREVIFERFQQLDGNNIRKLPGSGLGLSIVREFADLHRGRVRVEDSRWGGALFVVSLPSRAPSDSAVRAAQPGRSGDEAVLAAYLSEGAVVGSQPQPAQPATDQASGPANGPLVLVVEDDPEMSQFVGGILSRRACVITASNGKEGLALAESRTPDLIVSDIMMPEMSGDQMVELLLRRSWLQDVPVLLLSARADEALRIRLLKKGAQDYVTKPFSLEELEARAANLLEMSLAKRALRSELQESEASLADLANLVIDRKRQAEEALTAQRRAESSLRRLNAELETRVAVRTADLESANRELEAFTAMVSHDLRAPLRTMAGMSSMLLEETQQLDPVAARLAERIIAAAKKMGALIDDLLTLSWAERASLTTVPVRLDELCQEAVDSASADIRDRSAEVTVEMAAVAVMANRTLLGQTLDNLLGNALKFVEPGKRPHVRIRTEVKSEAVRLWVEDNGIGIPREDTGKVFQAFQRLHSEIDYAGTGLGLAIVAKSVQRMSGTFGVESTPGQGSRFWLELPLAPPASIRSGDGVEA